MIKVVTSISYPSGTVPGRSVSSYISTPIINPTQNKVIKALQEHYDSLQSHLKICDPDKIKINISVG